MTGISFFTAMLAAAVASHGEELFQAATDGYERVESLEPHVLRSRQAILDRDRLLGSADGSRLVLNLFPDARFEARVVESRPVSRGSEFVYSTLKHGGHATLFIAGGIVRGEVHSPSGIYMVRSNAKGRVRIDQVDASALPAADHGTTVHERVDAFRDWHMRMSVSGQAVLSDEEEEEAAELGPDETVDLLVMYTPAAEAHEGGRTETEATIVAEVAKTNQALANSGLGHRQIRLVAMERAEHEQTEIAAANALGDWKGISVGDQTGILDEVFELRHRYGADMVHLFAEGTYRRDLRGCGASGSYGLRDMQRVEYICSSPDERRSIGVDAEGCLTTVEKLFWRGKTHSHSAMSCNLGYTFTHEVGHSFGIYHDRYIAGLSLVEPVRFPIRPYGFGYVNQNFDRPACHRTIMSYANQCYDEGYENAVLEPIFSNPDLELGSEENGFDPAGVAGDESTVEMDGPVNASKAIDDVWNFVANLYSKTESGHDVPFLPAAGDDRRQGFVRVVNHAPKAGTVTIRVFDDAGQAYGPVTLDVDAGETVHFNSEDLEMGNPAKSLSGGVGDGNGDWRLKVASLLDIEVLAFVRTVDGFLTSMHDLMPATGPGRRAPFFNPGSNENQVSMLRLVNDQDEEAEVLVTAVDDDGVEGGEVRIIVPPHAARTYTAKELEEGSGEFEGAFGDGSGKWRLFVESVWEDSAGGWWAPAETFMRVLAMSLLESPTGHVTNLSTVPRNEYRGTHTVPLFPAKSSAGRQGFARVVNFSDEAAEASILAFDEVGTPYGPVTLSLDAGETAHFNSDDLEDGNAAKGLSGGIGSGVGDWRFELTSDSKLEVLAYVRTDDGFVTAMHEAAPSLIHTHRAPVFNPASNANQVSSLRLVNPGEEDAEVTITGIDDDGTSPEGGITVTVPPKASKTFTSRELEAGGSGFEGSLGDGAGKWQLVIHADREIVAMSLLESPTGHLTNLSTAPVRGAGPVPLGGEPVPDATPGSTFRELLRYTSGRGPEMVVVPAGTFRMGCLSDDADCSNNELPVREVTISQPFALSVHEITFDDYDRYAFRDPLDETEADHRNRVDDEGWGRGRRPVINVSWQDARDYAEWLSRETGADYRLASEAEWEYAARAGTETKYTWGDEIGSDRSNCAEDACGDEWEHTAPTGSFAANAFGLHDMHGNVAEMVADCYNESHEDAPGDARPRVDGNCRFRVRRGGSWETGSGALRSAARVDHGWTRARDTAGFRVVRTFDR